MLGCEHRVRLLDRHPHVLGFCVDDASYQTFEAPGGDGGQQRCAIAQSMRSGRGLGAGSKFDAWQVVHQTGPADCRATDSAYRASGIAAHVHPFFENSAAILADADLVISRAGAQPWRNWPRYAWRRSSCHWIAHWMTTSDGMHRHSRPPAPRLSPIGPPSQ